MKRLVLTIPALYGDHHTTAVRKILEPMEGLTDVYVSSASHVVALSYDPKKANPEVIEAALAEQGYEAGVPEPTYASSSADRSTRQTDAFAGTSGALAFAEQTLIRDGRPLWPCPGFDIRSPHKVA